METGLSVTAVAGPSDESSEEAVMRRSAQSQSGEVRRSGRRLDSTSFPMSTAYALHVGESGYAS